MGKGGQKVQTVVEVRREDFYHTETKEPHSLRRKLILEKHPEIESLFGNDTRPVPYVVGLVAFQLVMAYLTKYMSIPVYILTAWIVGGAVSHSLSLMTHECSHNLIFKTKTANEYFAIFCNIGMGLPSASTFKRYHMEHHQFQGFDGIDVDIPTPYEGNFFTTPLRKILFLLLQPVFYGARPDFVRPKTLNQLDIINRVAIVVTDAAVCYLCGFWGLLYLILSLLLGMGIHPCAGHFIAEHYVFEAGHETYSYYGALNMLCWNVGYHNEHHDFPRVPGWRLPQVKALAPEFYDNLPQHKSWTYVLWRFVFDPKMTPYSRVVRKGKASSVPFDAKGVDSETIPICPSVDSLQKSAKAE
jgi:sphingolipid delta-4 desaturase